MQELSTDYLVIGAGASAMAFVDALVTQTDDVDVVLVDRRDRPGGHWLDAYPFVRLHQPSANYGVASRRLGGDRVDSEGPNAGFYERATAPEICDYFAQVLDEQLVPSGRVHFLGSSEHRGVTDGAHLVVSLVDGRETRITVRRKVVDATYVESSIPSTHRPAFDVDPGVRFVPPNALPDLDIPAAGLTVLGGGKTAMDTVNWLLDGGVDPDRIRWLRPRDSWLFDRASMQPLELVGAYIHLQASWVAASAAAEDGHDFAHHLEADGVFHRIDADIEPEAFRGAIASTREVAALRSVTRLVRGARVERIEDGRLHTDQGAIDSQPGQVYVDCTAAGVRSTSPRPMFEDDRITLQYTTIGIVPWSASIVGFVEALDGVADGEKNRLCPPVTFTGSTTDLLHLARSGMNGMMARSSHPDIAGSTESSRLNPAAGAASRRDDPRVADGFTRLGQHVGGALQNLERRTRGS